VSTGWSRRLFSTTRGRIVALLRGRARTVNDLAAALGLTQNAVRAHLATLERDGLVEARGTRRGVSKPSIAYDLTDDGERLFARAHEPVLRELLAVLAGTTPPTQLRSILQQTGRRLAAGSARAGGLEARVEAAVAAFEALGGALEVERRDGALILRGRGCPLGSIVAERPELCQLGEALVTELVGVPARSCCEPGPRPRCCFELRVPPPAA
jgi:predicted ArsR family transcriptional regulator